MERTPLLQDNTMDRNGCGTLLVAGDHSPHVFSQPDDDDIQTNGARIRANAHALKQHRPARYGLPCANCKAYYGSDLPACPICKCAERVLATAPEAKSATMLKKPSGGVLQRGLRSFINLDSNPTCGQRRQLGVHRDEDGKRFLLGSKWLLCATTDEIDAGASSACILDENHNTPHESASVSLSCYDQLREKLAHTEAALAHAEAALLMDLREAAQVIYEAVWADPSPAEPSRTYENAAQSLLNELRHRARMVRLLGPI